MQAPLASPIPPVNDVIFDFCGVLVDWQCRAALEGHFPQDIVDRICADDDPHGFFRYEDLMDGGAALADIRPTIAAEQGEDIARIFDYYIAHYADALPRLVPGMTELLHDLAAQGVRAWGLTNWAYETFPLLFAKYPELEQLLEDTVVSGEERLHKPDAGMYELAVDRFGIDPEHALFFDDTAKNVEGAIAAGLPARRFTDAESAREELRALGLDV